MSERTFDGLARIEQVTGLGMISVRGTLADAAFQSAVKSATGVAVPERGHVAQDSGRTFAWMSPDEILVVCAAADVNDVLGALHAGLGALHHMVTDVSDARAVFRIAGPASRDVLAKVCPVDLRPAEFTTGQFRRTRMAQVACAFWALDDTTFQLIGFRSVQDYIWDALTTVANPDAPVGHFAR
ncbi:MAG: sarcosine oxidase subunit gamma family protein [Pseudomonadota bacterium]